MLGPSTPLPDEGRGGADDSHSSHDPYDDDPGIVAILAGGTIAAGGDGSAGGEERSGDVYAAGVHGHRRVSEGSVKEGVAVAIGDALGIDIAQQRGLVQLPVPVEVPDEEGDRAEPGGDGLQSDARQNAGPALR